MTNSQFEGLRDACRAAAEMNSPESALMLAMFLGTKGAKQQDELANELAQWAFSFCFALNDQAND